ncbi:alpha/beta hydrolase [Nonlabens antarcticus]|uniref:alpha/beta hydrolase n=1 Tax=Nonlabens antarcticus TaxID=392714 RepID=UPI0018914480|nr:esterase [Nonlabens antarcticus]
MIKTVSYTTSNSYEILYPIKSTTENIWICLHGLGYLSTFFKRYFSKLDPELNAVIVPQAPSKFYLDKKFKHVGASWLTRVDTEREMQNNLYYLKALLRQEHIYDDPRLVIMGYSQGVSIATRFLKDYEKPIKALIMHSGSIPAELDAADGTVFQSLTNRFIHIAGTKDEYLTDELIEREEKKIKLLFGTDCELHRPEIKHEVDTDLLLQISKTL